MEFIIIYLIVFSTNEMEYSLLKQLEPNIGHLFPNSTHPQLSAYPALDFVNPGIGQLARIHNFIVPLHAQDTLHLIEKENDLENTQNVLDLQENLNDQVGSGFEEPNVALEQKLIEQQKASDPQTLNEKKRLLMGESIHQSFQHPKKIKIEELNLKKGTSKILKMDDKIGQGSSSSSISTSTSNSKQKQKNIKHKFAFY